MCFTFHSVFRIDFQKKLFLKKTQEEHINRIYSLFFKEELHFIINKYNETIKQKLPRKNILYKKMNFIRIKNYINIIHYSNLLKHKNFIIYNLFIIKFNLINYEVLSILIEFIFILFFYIYKYNLPSLEKSTLFNDPINYDCFNTLNSNTYKALDSLNHIQFDTAIHRNFLFMEHHCINYDSIIECNLNSYIHPEIIIRILRKYIKDISILHILRNIFGFLAKTITLNQKLCLNYINLLKNTLSNIIALEIDNNILKNCIYLEYCLNKQSIYQDEIINYRKWKTLEFEYFLLSIMKIKEFSFNERTIYIISVYIVHYLRYELSFLFIFRGNISLGMLIYQRLNRFYKRRINIKLIYKNLYYNNFSENNFRYFNLLIQNQTTKIKIDTIGYSDSFFICYSIQYESIFAPIDPIIKSLYLLQLCTQNGYPIRKLSWISINDSQIISQFQKIYEYFLFFYSGVINHIVISYLYHIVNDSCLKTLAGKHKTNIKSVVLNTVYEKQINNQLSKQFIQIKRNLLSPLSLIIKNRIWHVDLIQQEILNLKEHK